MKKFMLGIMLIACALCAHAEVRVFQDSTNPQKWEKFLSFLTEKGQVEKGEVNSLGLASLAYGWARQTGLVVIPNEEFTTKFAPEFFRRNKLGPRISLRELQTRGRGAGFFIPDSLLVKGVVTGEVRMPSTVEATPIEVLPSSVDKRVSEVQKNLTARADATSAFVARINGGLDKERAERAKLEAKIASLERQLKKGGHASQVTSLRTELHATKDALTALKRSESARDASLTAHADDIASLDARVSTNETALRGIGTTLQAFSPAVGWVTAHAREILVGCVILLLFMLGGVIGRFRSTRALKRRVCEVELASRDAKAMAVEARDKAERAHSTSESLSPRVEKLEALVGTPEVIFPDAFRVILDGIARSPSHSPYTAMIRVEDVPAPLPITVSYGGKEGYVKVSGIPGHDANAPVLLHNEKRSAKYNGAELLVLRAASAHAWSTKRPVSKKKKA